MPIRWAASINDKPSSIVSFSASTSHGESAVTEQVVPEEVRCCGIVVLCCEPGTGKAS